MSYLKFILWCFFFVVILACNKQKKYKTRAQGLVVEGATGNPVPNAWVAMKDGMGSSGPISVGNASGDGYVEMYTNDKGEFDLELEGSYSANITAGKENYYPYKYANEGASVGWRPLNRGLNSGLVIGLESIGRFNPILKHKNIGNMGDTLNVNLLSYRDKDTPILGGLGEFYQGIGPFEFSAKKDGIRVSGNRYHPFRVRFRPANGVWVEYLDSAFVPAFGTLKDTIYYPKP